MKSRVQPSTLTAISAITAGIAAIALTACGPHDVDANAAAPVAQAQPAAPTPAPLQGTPVPPAVVGPAPAPAYAPPPPVTVARTEPSYPAQSSYPAQPAPTGYAPQPNYVAERPAAAEPRAVDRSRIGSVASIQPIRNRPQGSGAGAVIGGVLGAVVGNQFGHGGGRAAMTGVGAVGGAVAGNNIERNQREAVTGYRVSIRLDNGTTRSFERSRIGALHVGDRVRVEAGTFRRV